jgi:hypothetical protein
MKKAGLYIVCIFLAVNVFAQTKAETYFNNGARLYCQDKTDSALVVVEEGLLKHPNDQKLKELYKKLKEKKNQEKNNEQQQKQQQQNKNQQQQQQKQQQAKMSNEEAQRLLEALGNEENKVQQKLEKKKGEPQNVKVEKDW